MADIDRSKDPGRKLALCKSRPEARGRPAGATNRMADAPLPLTDPDAGPRIRGGRTPACAGASVAAGGLWRPCRSRVLFPNMVE